MVLRGLVPATSGCSASLRRPWGHQPRVDARGAWSARCTAWCRSATVFAVRGCASLARASQALLQRFGVGAGGVDIMPRYSFARVGVPPEAFCGYKHRSSPGLQAQARQDDGAPSALGKAEYGCDCDWECGNDVGGGDDSRSILAAPEWCGCHSQRRRSATTVHVGLLARVPLSLLGPLGRDSRPIAGELKRS